MPGVGLVLEDRRRLRGVDFENPWTEKRAEKSRPDGMRDFSTPFATSVHGHRLPYLTSSHSFSCYRLITGSRRSIGYHDPIETPVERLNQSREA